MPLVQINTFNTHLIMQRNPRFEARLYKARPDRGPQNKEWTRKDLHRLLYKMKGVKVLYNHGDDERFRDEVIGEITGAHLDDEDYLVVKGMVFDPDKLGEEKWNAIRNELSTGLLKMVSMHWTGETQFPTNDESKKIAIPESREMLEVSLVDQGFYPEASIIAVAASKRRTDQKTHSPLLTSDKDTTSSMIKRLLESMSESEHTGPSLLERHAALRKAMGKISPEDEKALNNDPNKILELYAEAFPQIHKELLDFRTAKKREVDEYVTRETGNATQLAERLAPLWEDEGERAKLSDYFKSDASVPEQKEKWGFVNKLTTKYLDTHKELSELKSALPAIPTSDVAPIANTSSQMSVAASLQRNEPKKQNSQVNLSTPNGLVQHLLAELNRR